MAASNALERLGFGEYEARAYVALAQLGAATGYEVAKSSGIPRPNVYGVLQKLEERGAVVRVESPDSTRYVAVPVEEVLDTMERGFQQNVSAARRELAQLSRQEDSGHLWSFGGYGALLEHARSVLAAARERLWLALYPEEALALAGDMAEAEARGAELTTLCMAGCQEPCGGCRGFLLRSELPTTRDARWLLVVADEREVVAGEIYGQQEAVAARTRQPLLVDLAGWFIRHSITLATMLNELGSRLEGMLGAESREAAASTVRAERTSGDWLSSMRKLFPE